MADLYDARGNRYLVASPDEVEGLPASAAEAVRDRSWIAPALSAFRLDHHERKLSDGLLVGPFQAEPPFDVLIVNTDGTLAERSGNGLTIFANALRDHSLAGTGDSFELHVHHSGHAAPTPLPVMARLGPRGSVWLDIGRPAIGPEAVGAAPGLSEVSTLAELDLLWRRSVFVRLGNPHCVTMLAAPRDLPSIARLRTLQASLTRIAFAPPIGVGSPCPGGVNLQWAAPAGPNLIAARIFERGEGPTRSSGTSACAVATAAHHLGLVDGPIVRVRMPGGTAQLEVAIDGAGPARVRYRGIAKRLSALAN